MVKNNTWANYVMIDMLDVVPLASGSLPHVHIKLNGIHTHIKCFLERLEGVFRNMGLSAAMAYFEHGIFFVKIVVTNKKASAAANALKTTIT